jgi:hypothetical protein
MHLENNIFQVLQNGKCTVIQFFFVWLANCLVLGAVMSQPVTISGRQLFVDGTPFFIKGVCYSPVPISESVIYKPYL